MTIISKTKAPVMTLLNSMLLLVILYFLVQESSSKAIQGTLKATTRALKWLRDPHASYTDKGVTASE